MRTLKTQIILALGLLTALLAIAVLYALQVVEQQRQDDRLLRLGGELRVLQQGMGMQAMHYKQNAPRDYPTYYRDIRLYYQDLEHARRRLGTILRAFAEGHLPPSLQSHHAAADFELPPATARLARTLYRDWQAFDATLTEKLGDPKEPRLEWASEWVLERHQALSDRVAAFLESLEHELEAHTERALLAGKAMLLASVGLMLAVLAWFYARVLAPLQLAVRGFRRVAAGDFSHRVPVPGDNEIGWLVATLNLATGRLDALLRILTRLQRTSGLDDALATLAEALPGLVPVDWVGMLVLAPDGRMRFELAYDDGRRAGPVQQDFTLAGTLLQECLHSGAPLHIADVGATTRLDSHYRFLKVLHQQGRNEAVFMPILGNEPRVGVLVLAARTPNSFTPEHLELLNNLSSLFSATFGRTLELTENARLAAIGQFTSGIVHEIRTPLSTIGLVLDHLATLEGLPPGGQRRVELARAETQRLGRLMEDILLYAKPLTLERRPLRLAALLDELAETAVADPRLHLDRDALEALPELPLDRDRMLQVLNNLVRNALEANGDDPRGVRVTGALDGERDEVRLVVENGGEPIPPDLMPHLFEPFYTSKRGGTGLGLAIVRRIVEAHGGRIEIQSDALDGTHVTVTLPRSTGGAADQAASSD